MDLSDWVKCDECGQVVMKAHADTFWVEEDGIKKEHDICSWCWKKKPEYIRDGGVEIRI